MYQELMDAYRTELIEHINRVDAAQFEAFVQILLNAYHQDKQIFIMGNGGSAATANHFVCDFGKNAVQGNKRRFRILSVCDNLEKITALGNDLSFDEIFRQQLMNLMNDEDVLIAISASGNSPDLVRALEYANERHAHIVSLAGFDGGKIKSLSQVTLVAEMSSYERIEDMHLMILHMVVCFMKEHQELLESETNQKAIGD
ncbi:MAG: SIS domain-containing protein [Clostridia bacterium]